MSAPAARHLDFYFDIGSPYSYLAAERIAAGALSPAVVRWRPFLLGAVFKVTGNHSPASAPAKARWMLEDLGRCATDIGVPFAFPSRFPLNTLVAQRALVAASRSGGDATGALAAALFRAYWVDDRDVSDRAEVAAIATAAGLDGGALVEATGAQPIKDELRRITEEAVAAGAFGAPSFVVDGALFWGHDPLDQVREAALGPG